jgi:hypothetical protein
MVGKSGRFNLIINGGSMNSIYTYLDCKFRVERVTWLISGRWVRETKCGNGKNLLFRPDLYGGTAVITPVLCRIACINKQCPVGFPL